MEERGSRKYKIFKQTIESLGKKNDLLINKNGAENLYRNFYLFLVS